MATNAEKKRRRLILSPEKSFDLPVYAEQLASAFADFGTSKPKRRTPSYALNVLQFIDGSASEGRETSDSSSDKDSATESTAT
jgi:hypothetical protein